MMCNRDRWPQSDRSFGERALPPHLGSLAQDGTYYRAERLLPCRGMPGGNAATVTWK